MAKKVELFLADTLGQQWRSWPVTSGIPFPQGELSSSDNARVLTSANREVPSQMRVMSAWPDGSVKWLLVDFQANVARNQKSTYRLEYGKGVSRTQVNSPLRVKEDKTNIKIDTGEIKFSISRKRFTLFEHVVLNGQTRQLVGGSEKQGSIAVDDDGEVYYSSLGGDYHAVVEEQGPLRVVIRCEGWHANKKKKKFLKLIARVHVYAQKSFIRVDHTFVDAEHPKQKTLKKMEVLMPPQAHHFYHYSLSRKAYDYLGGLSVNLPISVGAKPQYEIGGHAASNRPVNVVQYVDDSYWVHKGTSTNPDNEIEHGKHLIGWVNVGDHSSGITVGVRHCWQNFPKAFVLEKNRISTQLWPTAVPPATIAKGVAKTHSLFFYFHKGNSSAAHSSEVMMKLESGLLAATRPEWYANSLALKKYIPVDRERFPKGERYLEDVSDKLIAKRSSDRMYGMLAFGDQGSSNAEGDLHRHAFLRYLRTGDRRSFDYAETMSQHFMDVDIRHYHTNPKLEGGAVLHSWTPLHFELGVHICHNYVEGMLLHYFLTGNERAFEVAKKMGDCMINIMQSNGLATHDAVECGESCGRDNGRILIGLSELYEATGDKKYLDGAHKAFKYLRDSQLEDGSWYSWTPAEIDHKMGFDRSSDPDEWNAFSDKGGISGSIVLRGLMKLHQATGDESVMKVFLKGMKFMLNSGLCESGNAFLFGTFQGNPLRHAETKHSWHAARNNPGFDPSHRMLANLAYAFEITNEREYMHIARRVYEWLISNDLDERCEMHVPYYLYEASRLGYLDAK